MEIKFLGSAKEVGRSAISIEDEIGNKTLLDCGILFGNSLKFPDIKNPKDFSSIIISHAHLDHTGYLPFIVKHGFKEKIFCTKPTKDFIQVLLSDFLKIQENCGFSFVDIENVIKNMEQKEYDESFKLQSMPINVKLTNAGHILGSSCINLEFNDKKLLYSGDINTRNTYLLDGTKSPKKLNYLIIESTYGGYDDKIPSQKQAITSFCKKISETINRKGTVLIPSFAVGRSQEILMILENNMRGGRIPKVPIYIDGMISKANKIHRHNIIYGCKEIQLRILMSDDDPFKFKYFKKVEKKNKYKVYEKPCIIVTTSGMLNGGPILSYLKKFAKNEKNSIILVGYQVEGTRGRQLIEKKKKIVIDEQEIDVNLEVEHILFSAHADRSNLLSYINSIQGLEKIFINHGEIKKMNELIEGIKLKKAEIIIPSKNECFNI